MSIQTIKTKKDSEFILDNEIDGFEDIIEGTVISNKERSPKVNINSLMDRVREEKRKEKKENLIFLGLIASVILITGAIASF